jgi:hypothetical protein
MDLNITRSRAIHKTALKPSAYRQLSWREGTHRKLSSRFAAVRVSAAHRDHLGDAPRDQEWLLIEWPKGESDPTKYFLSTLPADISRKELVAAVKIRWRIERDYQELKQEFGLDATGAAFITTPRCALRPTAFSSANVWLTATRLKKLRLPHAAFPTRRLRPAGRGFVLNDMSTTQFRPCAGTSPPSSLKTCIVAPVAVAIHQRNSMRDTV